MNTDAPIAVERLSRHFGSLKAVDSIDLTVNAGEIFGFLGPNGAGINGQINIVNGHQ